MSIQNSVRPLLGFTQKLAHCSRKNTAQWGRKCRVHRARSLQTSTSHAPPSRIPNFAFAFDIDGVLVRSSDALPRASATLKYLQAQRIPFLLLTNGGGKYESERVNDLSKRLDVPLDVSMFVQSHTPFADMDELKDRCVLVLGGDGDKCRDVAHKYGFNNVVIPADIIVAHPEVWPFARVFLPYYKTFAKPLPASIHPGDSSKSLKIDAVFVYNDPRDWGLDLHLVLDILLSHKGIMGTFSDKNGDDSLPNRGYQQDGQPTLYFSNPDLLWAAKYHLPRLGQGGFREALEGVWAAVTGGPEKGVELKKVVIGKPYKATYDFAEKRLLAHRKMLVGGKDVGKLDRVFMVGDNPESDIRGGNMYESPVGTDWQSILVKTGVYRGGAPKYQPEVIVEDVYDAVEWAVREVGWADGLRKN